MVTRVIVRCYALEGKARSEPGATRLQTLGPLGKLKSRLALADRRKGPSTPVLTLSSLDGEGALVASDCERHIAELQKADAQVLKQQRMAVEEVEAADKRRKGGEPAGVGTGGAHP